MNKKLEQAHCVTFFVTFFAEHLTEEPNYKFSAECPCLGRNEKSIILIHMGDLIFTGDPKSMKPFFQRFKANLTPV